MLYAKLHEVIIYWGTRGGGEIDYPSTYEESIWSQQKETTLRIIFINEQTLVATLPTLSFLDSKLKTTEKYHVYALASLKMDTTKWNVRYRDTSSNLYRFYYNLNALFSGTVANIKCMIAFCFGRECHWLCQVIPYMPFVILVMIFVVSLHDYSYSHGFPICIFIFFHIFQRSGYWTYFE